MTLKIALAALLFVGALATAPACSAADRAGQDREISVAMDFLASLGRLDFDAAGQVLADDASLDLPFAGTGLIVHGRQDILQFFRRSMTNSIGAIEYRLDRAYPSREANAIVLEVSTSGRTAAGVAYRNRIVTIFEFRGGKIALFREYFNPAPLRR